MLQPDDMQVDMIVTILDERKVDGGYEPEMYESPYGMLAGYKKQTGIRFNGKLIMIKAVSLPYICTTVYQENGTWSTNHMFDTRDWKFIRVTKEYIDVMMKGVKVKCIEETL